MTGPVPDGSVAPGVAPVVPDGSVAPEVAPVPDGSAAPGVAPVPDGSVVPGVAPVPDGSVVPGPDGRPRCPWGLSAPHYLTYHDQEWGRPLRGETAMFERLCLEAFQSGLSWLVILRKREGFRRAFAGFDPEVVAGFDDADTERLLADAGIVRNRAKIEAARRNARAVLALDVPLDELLWSFAPPPGERPRPRTLAEVPAVTPESTAMARELKRRGFSFVGPTTCYALMQATGLVDDHLRGCAAIG